MLKAFVVLSISLLAFATSELSASSKQLSEAEIIEKYPKRSQLLFEQLDLDLPAFSEIKQAYRQGDQAKALEQIIRYYRRKYVPWILSPNLPPARKDILELADDATKDIFTIQSRTYQQPRNDDGKLEWDDLGPEGDKEWAWMMNRHYHFNFLLTAFLNSRNDRYLETINEHLIEWIPSHPPPDHVTFSTSWRALEAARRVIDSWLAVFAYVRTEKTISSEAIFLVLTSIPEHAASLRDHHSFWGGNHKMTEKMAIAVCAIVWWEFKDSRSWLEEAVRVTRDELFKQTYPDGSYKELANHYQKVVAQNYLRLAKILKASQASDIDRAFLKRIEDVWDYFAYVMRPSGFGPLNNDSSLEDNITYLADANAFFQKPDWSFICSYGMEGTLGEIPTGQYFPWAGHAIMRNSWNLEAHWAFFNIGPHGTDHQHNDTLHISVSFGQNDFLVDSGRYIYKPGPMRTYFKSGTGHNVLQVDGKDPIPPPLEIKKPIDNRFEKKQNWDLYEGEVEFEFDSLKSKSVKQKRTVIYFRDTGWLVMDQILSFANHTYDSNWNFHPDCKITHQNHAITADFPDKTSASLRLLTPKEGTWDLAEGQESPEIRGWYSWAYNEKRPNTSARFRYLQNQPHVNAWWISSAAKTMQQAVIVEKTKTLNPSFVVTTENGQYRVFQKKQQYIVKPLKQQSKHP